MDSEKTVNSKIKATITHCWQKIRVWCRKHPVITVTLCVLFAATFFMRAESVEIRYSGKDVYDYVRVDYSIYGYCVNVVPVNQVSMQTAKDLKRALLFCGVDKSVDVIVDRWTYYHGDQEQFYLRVKGYRCDPIEKRNDLIERIKAKGFMADGIV